MSNTPEAYDPSQFLDADIADLPDLPVFGCWPTGAYMVQISNPDLGKEINGKSTFVGLTMTLLEVVECLELEEGEEKPKAGSTEDLLFDYSSVWGQGAWKDFSTPLAKHFATKSPRETIRAIDGAKLLIVQKRTYGKVDGKVDKDKKFPKIKQVAVV